MRNTADNFVLNTDEITKKPNYNTLVDKLVLKQNAYSSKITIFYSPFSKRKKAPIWELFFAFTVC